MKLHLKLLAWTILAFLITVTATAFADRPVDGIPIFQPLKQTGERRPLILVPGLTGTHLERVGDGDVVWGTGARFMRALDGPYDLAVSLNDPAAVTRAVPGGVIETISVGFLKKEIYRPIVELLEAHGYRRGDLDAPRPGDTLFLFGYDWRLDNEFASKRLHLQLEKLRRARGEERLAVDLLCQSTGATICRYLAKYGDASYAEALAGRAAPPRTIDIENMILVGTANGGSLMMLRFIDQGRRYAPPFGRLIQPEQIFTYVSFFQDLPFYKNGSLFVDAEGRPLEADVFDAATWERYGFSIFGRAARRRALARPEIFGTPDDWRRHLEHALAQARRLHELLRRDAPGFGGARVFLIQNDADPTPDRGVLVQKRGEWKLLITGDKELQRLGLAEAMSARGDGHASAASQDWLSPQEKAAMGRGVVRVAGAHFDLILDQRTMRHLPRLLWAGHQDAARLADDGRAAPVVTSGH